MKTVVLAKGEAVGIKTKEEASNYITSTLNYWSQDAVQSLEDFMERRGLGKLPPHIYIFLALSEKDGKDVKMDIAQNMLPEGYKIVKGGM
jgi:hypothetical protein